MAPKVKRAWVAWRKRRQPQNAVPMPRKTSKTCQAPGIGRGGHCKLHGGESAGPRTEAGKRRSSKAAGKRDGVLGTALDLGDTDPGRLYLVWVHGGRSQCWRESSLPLLYYFCRLLHLRRRRSASRC